MRSQPLRPDVAPRNEPCNRLDSHLESRGCRQGAGSRGPQRLAVAPEALVGASAAQRMLAELNQLVYALTPALHRRGAAQRAVLLPAEPVTPSLEPRGESSP